MKKGVMIINTSRGAIVNTQDLLLGLESGQIGNSAQIRLLHFSKFFSGYAGLDVYENERPFFFNDHSFEIIPDHILTRLSSMPNVILTGHQAYLTRKALEEIARVTLQNITDFFWRETPQPLPNQVIDEWKKAKEVVEKWSKAASKTTSQKRLKWGKFEFSV